MKLMVVESEHKAQVLNKYLAKEGDWRVVATKGHIKKLKGVDLEELTGKYLMIPEKTGKVEEICSAAAKAEAVYLATDPDREGECIARDLHEEIRSLNDATAPISRVYLKEITESELKRALKSPTSLDMNLVQAGDARRIVDFWFGIGTSQDLKAHHEDCPSAGRVQSPALRLIQKKDQMNRDHVTKQYYVLPVSLRGSSKRNHVVNVHTENKGKLSLLKFKSDSEASKMFTALVRDPRFTVTECTNEAVTGPSIECLDTAACLKAAGKQFGLSVEECSHHLQGLYEQGLITYIRTDSTRISNEARQNIRQVLRQTHPNYIDDEKPKDTRTTQRTSKRKAASIQDAHEAIRPTNCVLTPERFEEMLKANKMYHQKLAVEAETDGKKAAKSKASPLEMKVKLYSLIWRTTMASEMRPPVWQRLTVRMQSEANPKVHITLTSKELRFDGYRKILGALKEDGEEDQGTSIPWKKGDVVATEIKAPKLMATQPPEPLTVPELIDTLKKKGIGRPSTYSKIVGILLKKRNYVTEMEKGHLRVTSIGAKAANFMAEWYPQWVREDFTAAMEKDLDSIAQGKVSHIDFLRAFRQKLSESFASSMKASLKLIGTDPATHLNIWLGKTSSGSQYVLKGEAFLGKVVFFDGNAPEPSLQSAISALANNETGSFVTFAPPPPRMRIPMPAKIRSLGKPANEGDKAVVKTTVVSPDEPLMYNLAFMKLVDGKQAEGKRREKKTETSASTATPGDSSAAVTPKRRVSGLKQATAA